MSHPLDVERVLEFEFVRATENAALNAIHWLGRGEKEKGDAAACDAIYGVFDRLDIRGEVVIGEGIKDSAPGIFVGERLGTWRDGSPRFSIALDPIDGTTNLAKGMPNSISVIAAAQVPEGAPNVMRHLPSYYSFKIAYGPLVAEAMFREGNPCLLDMPLPRVLRFAAKALGKHVRDLVVMTLDRPRHADIVRDVRETGAGLRMIGDGDITAAVAPSLPDSGIDLYVGAGGSPEAVLAAAALRCLGGDMQSSCGPAAARCGTFGPPTTWTTRSSRSARGSKDEARRRGRRVSGGSLQLWCGVLLARRASEGGWRVGLPSIQPARAALAGASG
jgi:fructose-1,6-bisphosphatase II